MSTSSDISVACENVGKAYQFYRHPFDQIRQLFATRGRKYYQEYWALHDISFTIRPGDSLGIVGRNGSGKTTLLQILCGITAPTVGQTRVNGRIAPVLALGAAFDYELSGRENVYLTGAILGMKRARINAVLPAIRELAGLGDFFEQPVKLYSSGMGARLAFAISAHADGDIMIVDEALSVGDDAFRQRCEALIAEFRKRGTMIFVSHSPGQVAAICDRVLWIDRGRVRADGAPATVLADYTHAMATEPDDPNRFNLGE